MAPGFGGDTPNFLGGTGLQIHKKLMSTFMIYGIIMNVPVG